MENHIGLAFTADTITFAYFTKNNEELILSNLDKISYPFPYDESVFFLEENIIRLANLILNHCESLQIHPNSVSISIESNLCLTKRIEIPHDFKTKNEAEHIHWDLGNSVISSLDNYVYLKTNTCYDYQKFKEILVIALRKDIIDFFQSFADFAKIKLKNMSTNQLAAEVCVNNIVNDSSEKLNLVHRITSNRLESICLLNGSLFMSKYEKLKPGVLSSNDEILLEKISGYTKFVENYFEQSENTQRNIDHIYIYGSELNENFISHLNKNISTPLAILNPIKNVKLSQELSDSLNNNNNNNLSGFVECIGVALDAD